VEIIPKYLHIFGNGELHKLHDLTGGIESGAIDSIKKAKQKRGLLKTQAEANIRFKKRNLNCLNRIHSYYKF
jgi:hypothetical protein